MLKNHINLADRVLRGMKMTLKNGSKFRHVWFNFFSRVGLLYIIVHCGKLELINEAEVEDIAQESAKR